MRTYREGELLVFDDSWEHEARAPPHARRAEHARTRPLHDEYSKVVVTANRVLARQVWNRHPTQCRVVLLVRFWHPDIPPAKYAATKQRLKRMLTRHRRATLMPPLY